MGKENQTAVKREGHVQVSEKEKKPLYGTWMSLGILGAVILGTYILMFWFYMVRV